MNIKLNNKNYIIKHSDNMTVSEYIKLTKLDNINLISYLSVILNVEFAKIADLKFQENDLKIISSYVGAIKSYDYFLTSKSESFYFGFFGKTYYSKNVNWDTVGTRMLLETKKDFNIVEMAIYLLAIVVSESYDNEVVERNYNRLQNSNYIHCLSFIAFFLQNFLNGSKNGQRFLRLQMMEFFRNIRKKLKK